mmetsp:Transcript_96263/g.201123  ORF Transcript_96263/g.201123 Transcript_96263/m.201123 type:complete len:249 (-) Transcript_96263:312-1058(-)
MMKSSQSDHGSQSSIASFTSGVHRTSIDLFYDCDMDETEGVEAEQLAKDILEWKVSQQARGSAQMYQVDAARSETSFSSARSDSSVSASYSAHIPDVPPHPLSTDEEWPESAGLPSTGSDKHHNGECCPCKFFRSKRGCRDGRSCSFCHYSHRELSTSYVRRFMKKKAIEETRRLDEAALAQMSDDTLSSSSSEVTSQSGGSLRSGSASTHSSHHTYTRPQSSAAAVAAAAAAKAAGGSALSPFVTSY